jgi:hypothetical protein
MNKFFMLLIILCSLSVQAYDANGQDHGHIAPVRQMLIEGTGVADLFAAEVKCGTGLLTEIISNRDVMSDDQILQLDVIMQIPSMETSIVSPKGYFRVHYDTSGTSPHSPDLTDSGGNGVPDYIDSVAAIFDHVWEYQTDIMGYDPPYLEAGEKYNIFVLNMRHARGFFYGETVPYRMIPGYTSPPRHQSFIRIDHKYEGYPTWGLDGLRVTAAHEFHHAVQFGAYGNWLGSVSNTPSRFFYEVTSTWIEDVLYPDINDYYFYLPALLNENISMHPFYSGSGMQMYARAIFGHFIENRFGRDMMRRIWEIMRHTEPLEAIDEALRERETDFSTELAEYHLWKFYTGRRARAGEFFPGAEDYPTLPPKSPPMQHFGESVFSGMGTDANPLDTQTLHFHALISAEGDTVYFLVSNIYRVPDTYDNNYVLRAYSYRMPDTAPVGNGLFYRTESNYISRWKTVPLTENSAIVQERIHMYPNPFRPDIVPPAVFVVGSVGEVRLTILSADMRLVYSSPSMPSKDSADRNIIRWNGRDSRGEPIASGVYIYVIEQEGDIRRGKLTVIRE